MSILLLIAASVSQAIWADNGNFDCSRHNQKDEQIICADGRLKELDAVLNGIYGLIPLERRKQIKTDQLQWLKSRADCGTQQASANKCIYDLYRRRILDLARIGQANDPTWRKKMSGLEKPEVIVEFNPKILGTKLESDAASFRKLGGPFAVDKFQIYGICLWRNSAATEVGEFLLKKSTIKKPALVSYLGGYFAKDSEHIFYCGEIFNADVNSFEVLSDKFVKDHSHVWWIANNEPPHLLKEADVQSFTTASHIGVDNAHTYCLYSVGKEPNNLSVDCEGP